MGPHARLRTLSGQLFFTKMYNILRALFGSFVLRAPWTVSAHIWRAFRYRWGKTILGFITHPHLYPRPVGGVGDQGSQICEYVDPNRTFQNSDLSSAMVSDTTCVAYGTHTHSRKLRSAAEGLQPSRQRRIYVDQITDSAFRDLDPGQEIR